MNIIVANATYNRFQRKIIETGFECLHKINPENRYRHISVLTDRKKIVEVGWNDEGNSYPNMKFGYLSIHSEFSVIRKFLKTHSLENLSKMDLWNLRVNRYNQLANSRPCRKCIHLLGLFSPSKIYFSNEDGLFERMK